MHRNYTASPFFLQICNPLSYLLNVAWRGTIPVSVGGEARADRELNCEAGCWPAAAEILRKEGRGIMKTKLLALFGMVAGMLVAVLAYPVLMAQTGVIAVGQHVPQVANGLIAWTFAQTLTLSDMSTETGTIVTGNVPSLAVFIAFFVIVAGASFLVGRLLRAGKA